MGYLLTLTQMELPVKVVGFNNTVFGMSIWNAVSG